MRLSSSLSGGSLGSGLLLGGGGASGLLLLDVLRDELLVLGGRLFGGLEAVESLSLDDLLAAEALLSDEALDLGGLVVGLVTTLDLTTGNILADVVLLAVEAEDGGDVALSLLEEAGGDLLVGAASDLLVTLLHDLQSHDAEVRAGDAATDGPSSAVAGSLGVEERSLYYQQRNRIKIDSLLLNRQKSDKHELNRRA